MTRLPTKRNEGCSLGSTHQKVIIIIQDVVGVVIVSNRSLNILKKVVKEGGDEILEWKVQEEVYEVWSLLDIMIAFSF